MLYLITPEGFVSTLDRSLGAVLVDAEQGRPLARQRWTAQAPGESVPADTVLALALRHGVDAGTGLMLHGGFVDTVLVPETLRAAERNQKRTTEQLATIALPERHEDRQWHRDRRAVQEAGRQAAVGRMRSAEKAAEELLRAPIKEHLAVAWERAGGLVPVS